MEREISLDRRSPVPLYHQIAEQLEHAIRQGTLAPGARLDSEIDLAKRYNISRPTLRQAMDKLVRDGLVVRRRGVGTQVVGPRVRRSLTLSSLYDDLRATGATPKTKVLSLEVVSADRRAAKHLQLPAGSEIYHLRRLRWIDDQPLGLMENILPLNVGELTRDRLADDGLYNLMRAHGTNVQMAHQTLGATVADEEQAGLLQISVGAPMVTMQRIALDGSGVPVEYGNHLYRGDLYTYETTLTDR